MGISVTLKSGVIPKNTRETSVEQWVVDTAKAIMAVESGYDEEGNFFGGYTELSADGVKGSATWVKETKAAAASVAAYMRNRYQADLKARDLKVGTQLVKGQHSIVKVLSLTEEADEADDKEETQEGASENGTGESAPSSEAGNVEATA